MDTYIPRRVSLLLAEIGRADGGFVVRGFETTPFAFPGSVRMVGREALFFEFLGGIGLTREMRELEKEESEELSSRLVALVRFSMGRERKGVEEMGESLFYSAR